MILDALHAPANAAHVLLHHVLRALDFDEFFVVRQEQRGVLLLRFGDGRHCADEIDHGRFEHVETPFRLLLEPGHLLAEFRYLGADLLAELRHFAAHLLQQPDGMTFDVAVVAHNTILPPQLTKHKQHIILGKGRNQPFVL